MSAGALGVLADEQLLAGASARGIAEDFPLEGSRSLYAATKRCSELLIQEYGAMYGLRAIINRCGVLTGPWQMGKVDQGGFALWVAMHHFEGHSLFGASKAAADLLVQEYGRYFGMKTACFRGGSLTGPNHSGTALHGFLAYLMKCVVTGAPYTVSGYKGKQVRDNIHSADLVSAIYHVYQAPRVGEVYNMGGSRYSDCSMIEAIALCEEIAGKPLKWPYTEANRIGDHIWYISDIRKFKAHYPDWRQDYDLRVLLEDIYSKNIERWAAEQVGVAGRAR